MDLPWTIPVYPHRAAIVCGSLGSDHGAELFVIPRRGSSAHPPSPIQQAKGGLVMMCGLSCPSIASENEDFVLAFRLHEAPKLFEDSFLPLVEEKSIYGSMLNHGQWSPEPTQCPDVGR